MRRVLTLALLLSIPAALPAQEKEDKVVLPIKVIDLKRKEEVHFEKEIMPIFKNKCLSCHSGALAKEIGGKLDMSTYEGLIKGGKSRVSSIVPGKKETSPIYKNAGRTAKPYMPPPKEVLQTPLSPEELALIGLWLDQGAKYSGTGGSFKPPAELVSLPPSVQPSRAVAISADKSMVAASRANQIHIYDAKGDYVRSLFNNGLQAAGKPVKGADVSLVESLIFSPDNKYLVSGSFMEISIWDPKSGELIKNIAADPKNTKVPPMFAHEVVSLAFTADGKILATGGGSPTEDGEVKFFAVDTWKLLGEVKAGHSDTVYGLSFGPVEGIEITNDKKEKVKLPLMIATCSADKFIKVWEVPSGKFVKSFEGHTHHVLDVGWSTDGKLLASAGGDNDVKVWDFEKGEKTRDIKSHVKQVTRLMFIGKTTSILTCGGDAQVKILNAANGGVLKTFAGSTDFIYAIAASPDGTLVAAGGQEGVVRLYNGTTGQLIKALLPPDAQVPTKDEKKK